MDHYLDIRLLKDPEIAPYQVMSALVSKLHLALVQAGAGEVGVCFPEVNEAAPHLGTVVRLHGSSPALERVMALPWLTGLRDHVTPGPVLATPTPSGYRVVRRVQAKSSPERLRRRQIRRHGLSEQEAIARIPDHAAEHLRLPFVQLRSTSTGQNFRLFIQHGAIQEHSVPGAFGAYGLSHDATIPWF